MFFLQSVTACVRAQLMGGTSMVKARMRMSQGKKARWVMHSDGSIGNWRRDKYGRLVILDRNCYLHLNGIDLKHVAKALKAAGFDARARIMTDWLTQQPENQHHPMQKPDERERMVGRVLANVPTDLEPEARTRRLMSELLGENVDLTLKVALILKTMNVQRALANKVS